MRSPLFFLIYFSTKNEYSAGMKLLRLLLTVIVVGGVAGCGITMSDYEDAITDGIANLARGKLETALANFEKAIELEPNEATGYLGRANTLNTLGRWEESLYDYERALEIAEGKELANAYANRGRAYALLGEPRKAIADYEKALELDPKLDNPPTFIKRLFSNEPNTDKGIRKYLEALKKQVGSG